MSARVEGRASFVGLVALIALGAGCATPHAVIERRPDGITHLTCKTSLQVCLDEAEALCGHRSYAVTRAFDSLELKGDSVSPTESRTSEAFVCCVLGPAWGNRNNDPMAAPLCPAPQTAPPAAPLSRACAPGVSQACVGPAGCKGGQACAPDGAAFGPCDCGPAPAP